MMTNYEQLLLATKTQLLKAIKHLEYSYNKINKLPEDYSAMDDEIMETWESFSSRFSRVADIFLMKYIRANILMEDPGFKGSFRDHLNTAEKLNIIDDAKLWLQIRELRNISAHDYNDTDLTKFYTQLKFLCPKLIEIKNKL